MNAKIERKLQNAVTVADLIAMLQDCPPEARVVFASNYGDHGHTMQALLVTEVNEIQPGQQIEETAYSDSGLEIAEAEDEGETISTEALPPATVVILS